MAQHAQVERTKIFTLQLILVQNGVCAETTENFEVQIDECTNIPELSTEDILVYTTPASNAVNIEYTGDYDSSIE